VTTELRPRVPAQNETTEPRPAVEESSARTPPTIVRAGPVLLLPKPAPRLVWSDAFKVEGPPSADRWTALEHPMRANNNELQRYTASPENVFVRDGQLHIVAVQKPRADGGEAGDLGVRPDGRLMNPELKYEYSSARLVTEGKGDFGYGRIEVCAKLPTAAGTWPAIWMMPTAPTAPWPECGEIDIMEHVGCDIDVIHASLHSKDDNWMSGTQKTKKLRIDGVTDGFHVFAFERNAKGVAWFVDDQEILRVDRPKDANPQNWPFDGPYHLILNVAVGGWWGGMEGVDTKALETPQEMVVDYVRVFGSEGDAT
jgi:beta-glucanase (GH16 family)